MQVNINCYAFILIYMVTITIFGQYVYHITISASVTVFSKMVVLMKIDIGIIKTEFFENQHLKRMNFDGEYEYFVKLLYCAIQCLLDTHIVNDSLLRRFIHFMHCITMLYIQINSSKWTLIYILPHFSLCIFFWDFRSLLSFVHLFQTLLPSGTYWVCLVGWSGMKP